MNPGPHRIFLNSAILLLVLVSTGHAEVDGPKILAGMSVSPSEISQLENGAMLTFSDEAYESTNRELSADAMILVQSDLATIVKAIIKEPTLIPSHVVIGHAEIKSEADFSGMGFTDTEYGEVKKLFKAKPGDDLNFSASEYALLKRKLSPYAGGVAASQIAAASDAIREILINRYRHYLQNGLEGIESYARSRTKSVDIGRELRFTTETFKPFEGDFPEFYRVMHDYPKGAECCDHYFRWLKIRIRKRPTFVLAHTMVRKTDDYVLATERYYFASSTLNSLQVTLSWLKYNEDTYMGMAMSASTDILDSMMGRLLRPVGRNLAKNMVSDIMLAVKEDIEEVR